MGTFRTRAAAFVATGCLVATGLVAFAGAPASAATTFTVDNADDTGVAVPANCTTPVPGACGLNDAIAAAQAAGGDVTISLAVPGGVVNSTGNVWVGALANNGGPTPTLLPLTGSPLIDAIPAAACQSGSAAGITTDQRGLPRPGVGIGTGPNCDIGAVELQGTPAPTPAPTPIAIQPAFTG